MNRKILMASFLLANCLIANPKYGVSLTNEGDQLRESLAIQAQAPSGKNSIGSNDSFLRTSSDSSSFSSGDSRSLTETPALSRKSSIKTLSDEESPNFAPQNNAYSLRFPAKFANTDEGYAEFVVATAVAFNDYMKKIKEMPGVVPEEHGGVYTPEMLVNKTYDFQREDLENIAPQIVNLLTPNSSNLFDIKTSEYFFEKSKEITLKKRQARAILGAIKEKYENECSELSETIDRKLKEIVLNPGKTPEEKEKKRLISKKKRNKINKNAKSDARKKAKEAETERAKLIISQAEEEAAKTSARSM